MKLENFLTCTEFMVKIEPEKRKLLSEKLQGAKKNFMDEKSWKGLPNPDSSFRSLCQRIFDENS